MFGSKLYAQGMHYLLITMYQVQFRLAYMLNWNINIRCLCAARKINYITEPVFF
jgi:hypothetical protein